MDSSSVHFVEALLFTYEECGLELWIYGYCLDDEVQQSIDLHLMREHQGTDLSIIPKFVQYPGVCIGPEQSCFRIKSQPNCRAVFIGGRQYLHHRALIRELTLVFHTRKLIGL